MLAFAFVANYSGMSSTLGLAFAGTGALFPFFSPFLGWLGVFLTGSDTATNALFANLQNVTAQQIGVNPILTIAANTTGGVTGKMISPQSIAVACAAIGLVGKESDLFRFTAQAQPVLRNDDRRDHLHPGLLSCRGWFRSRCRTDRTIHRPLSSTLRSPACHTVVV